MNILFVSTHNESRGRTAELIFSALKSQWSVQSAGISANARAGINQSLIDWADVILTMEQTQTHFLEEHFEAVKSGEKPAICLHIPDAFQLMSPVLIQLLRARTAWCLEHEYYDSLVA